MLAITVVKRDAMEIVKVETTERIFQVKIKTEMPFQSPRLDKARPKRLVRGTRGFVMSWVF